MNPLKRRPEGRRRNGVLPGGVFPGPWLDAAALARGDLACVLAAAQQGVASPAHAAFVPRLRAAGAGTHE